MQSTREMLQMLLHLILLVVLKKEIYINRWLFWVVVFICVNDKETEEQKCAEVHRSSKW